MGWGSPKCFITSGTPYALGTHRVLLAPSQSHREIGTHAYTHTIGHLRCLHAGPAPVFPSKVITRSNAATKAPCPPARSYNLPTSVYATTQHGTRCSVVKEVAAPHHSAAPYRTHRTMSGKLYLYLSQALTLRPFGELRAKP